MAAEEHGLPAVVAEAVLLQAGDVAALWIVRPHARLERLKG